MWIGVKIPIPQKKDAKKWVELEQQVESEYKEQEVTSKKILVQKKHQLEKEIMKLEALPENPGRASLIKRLKSELGHING